MGEVTMLKIGKYFWKNFFSFFWVMRIGFLGKNFSKLGAFSQGFTVFLWQMNTPVKDAIAMKMRRNCKILVINIYNVTFIL